MNGVIDDRPVSRCEPLIFFLLNKMKVDVGGDGVNGGESLTVAQASRWRRQRAM